MHGSAALLLSRNEPLAQGSVAYANRMVTRAVQQLGWTTRPFRTPPATGSEEALLPLGFASSSARELAGGQADLALYDDAGSALRTPSRRWAVRNVMLYHGLAYGAGAWMGNSGIDLHCANSPYLACVLRNLFAFPDWAGRRCLDGHALHRTTDIQLPLPCLSETSDRQAFVEGADVPATVLQLLQGGKTVIGHALQPRKQDLMATTSILVWLNLIAREHGSAPVRLLLSAHSLEPARRQQIDRMLAPAGMRCNDLFILLPHLKQRELHAVMRASRFCLAYNHFPEPFGFYVLESVFHGSPVYTNGAGNNRYLLPEGHGIVVDETPDMAAETVAAAADRPIAERIHADLARPDEMHRQCGLGAERIASQWSPDAFVHSLDTALSQALRDSVPSTPFDELVVETSAMVRRLERTGGRCLNDYANTTLTPVEIALVTDLLGRRCAELDSQAMQEMEDRHGLFRRGILALGLPQESSRERLRCAA